MKTRITFISDTHTKHNQITNDLPGGDILCHSGDISSMGYRGEIESFCKWFDAIDNYNHKIFIAGNHDWGFQNNHKEAMEVVSSYKTIKYLQDSFIICDGIKIYGTPWQPEFCNWAFNLQKNGDALRATWDLIPADTDILLTHGPAFGILDDVDGRRGDHLGCELLTKRIQMVKPKIHSCGHIHSGNGYYNNGDTHFINAAVLGERYTYDYEPLTIDWDSTTNELIKV